MQINPMLWAILLAARLATFQLAQGAVLASSSLQTCVQNSSTNINCKKMLVLTVTVGNGQSLATEQLNFEVACVGR